MGKIIYQSIDSLVNQQMQGVSGKVLILMIIASAIVIHLITLIYSHKMNRKVSWQLELKYIMLVAYICFMYQMTFYNREPGSRTGVSYSLDFLAFDNISEQQIIYAGLNVVLFIPLGFFFRLIKGYGQTGKNILLVTLSSFLGSVFIECTQLITSTGYFELADIITNTSGGLIGAIIANVVMYWSAAISRGKESQESVSDKEAVRNEKDR